MMLQNGTGSRGIEAARVNEHFLNRFDTRSLSLSHNAPHRENVSAIMAKAAPLKILIIGLNYAPEPVGIAVYTTGLAQELAKHGHQVEVVCGKPYYPQWSVPADFRATFRKTTTEEGVRVTRVAHFVPSNPTGSKRLLQQTSFALSSLLPALAASWREKPDVVFTIAPALASSVVALLAARAVGAKSWLHIQDFEVEAAFATGLLSTQSRTAALAHAVEGFLLRRFDRVSSISLAMCERLLEKGVAGEKILEMRNWADIESIRPMATPSRFVTEFGITTPFVALYSGNMGNKQGLDVIIQAAGMLGARRDLTFVLCGEGSTRKSLEASALGLPNVKFFPLQHKQDLNELLGLATVHLLPQIDGAADLVLPSKLTNMLASGRPIIATCEPGTGLAREVAGCGLCVKPGDGSALAAAVIKLLDDAPLRHSYALEARRRAKQVWDFKPIYERFESGLEILCKSFRP